MGKNFFEGRRAPYMSFERVRVASAAGEPGRSEQQTTPFGRFEQFVKKKIAAIPKEELDEQRAAHQREREGKRTGQSSLESGVTSVACFCLILKGESASWLDGSFSRS